MRGAQPASSSIHRSSATSRSRSASRAKDFRWDTIYTPIFNAIERPVAPMLVIRVATDWYAHDSEFRYVLQPGESITASHAIPIGQVLFVPREEVVLRDATEAEAQTRREARDAFFRDKAEAPPHDLVRVSNTVRTACARAASARRNAGADLSRAMNKLRPEASAPFAGADFPSPLRWDEACRRPQGEGGGSALAHRDTQGRPPPAR